MLSEALIPSPSATAQRTPPDPLSDEENVRAPLPALDDILLPSAPALSPSISSTSSLSGDGDSSSASPLRYYLTRGLFVYLLSLAVASLNVALWNRRTECSALMTAYVWGNGVVSFLLALLLLYVNYHAPNVLSDMAVTSEHAESVRWVAVTCVKQMVGVADFVLFVLGHVSFFSASSACSASSLSLYAFTLLSLVSGYLGLVIPLLTFAYLGYYFRHFIFRARLDRHHYQPRPASQPELALLRTAEWVAAGGDEEVSVCSICYVEYEESVRVSTMPCDPHHAFHEECIGQWLSMRDSCPLCKARLRESLGLPRKERRKKLRRTGDARGHLSDLAPLVLPGVAAATLSLTSAYAEREERKSEAVASALCPAPSPIPSPSSVSDHWEEEDTGGIHAALDCAVDSSEVRLFIRVEEGGIEHGRESARRAAVAAAITRVAALKQQLEAPHQ